MMSISILVEIENGAPKARAKIRVMEKKSPCLFDYIKTQFNQTNEAAKNVSGVLAD